MLVDQQDKGILTSLIGEIGDSQITWDRWLSDSFCPFNASDPNLTNTDRQTLGFILASEHRHKVTKGFVHQSSQLTKHVIFRTEIRMKNCSSFTLNMTSSPLLTMINHSFTIVSLDPGAWHGCASNCHCQGPAKRRSRGGCSPKALVGASRRWSP